MNLHKRLLLLKHLNSFILEQFDLGQSTEDVIGMIRYKYQKYKEKESETNSLSTRKIYLDNYIFILNKRVVDFEYFRKRNQFRDLSDRQLFKMIDFRDRIIFKKIFND